MPALWSERRKRFDYRLRVADRHGEREIEDPYRFPPILGDLDLHLLAEGNHLRSFEKAGGASDQPVRGSRRVALRSGRRMPAGSA